MSSLERELDRRLREAQAERLPSVAAAVVRKGELVWSGAVGAANAEDGVEATPETQYRIGSITKTFTAVAVLQLRDAGLLDLDDRLEAHLPDAANGAPTLRRMLAHLSGLQREAGEMFVTGEAPTIEAAMAEYELVLPAARAHHYSNLAFGLLGEVIARRSGSPYTTYVDERVIAPLDLRRTTWYAEAPSAQGYLVDAWAGTLHREPDFDNGGVAAMGQLWSTVGDLCTWATFLATEPALDEMWFPQVMRDAEDWSRGWGLGIELANVNGRIYGGHGGAMPGHLAGVMVNRKTGVGAAALTNSGTQGAMPSLALALAEKTLELEPELPEVWRPEPAPPPEIAPLLGRWWSEGDEFVFTWQGGKLRADAPGSPAWIKPSVFEQIGEREFRCVEGRERGERLRVEDGQLVFAGYPFTRDQRTF